MHTVSVNQRGKKRKTKQKSTSKPQKTTKSNKIESYKQTRMNTQVKGKEKHTLSGFKSILDAKTLN